LKLFSFTEKKESIFTYTPWLIKNNNTWTTIDIEYKKNKKDFFLIKIKNINDRILAKQLTNVNILTEKYNLPILNINEYYWNDLINCRVISIYGDYLGIVDNLIYTGSNDILIVKNINKIDILIPFLHETIIKKVDIHNYTITVDWNVVTKK